MSEAGGGPRFWLDLFTEETWLEAAEHGFEVTGFTQGRWTTVQRIHVDDVLVCYLTRRSTYVGLLSVTGDAYLDDSKIWSSQVFPSRLPVKPLLVLRPDSGVPVRSLADDLSYFRNLPHPTSNAWTGYFRGSPASISQEDAVVIRTALQNAAADASRLLDVHHIPKPTQRRQRKRQLAAPSESVLTKRNENEQPLANSLTTVRALEPEDEVLARRVIEAASASEDAALFETALADAFTYLGFRTERRSGPGDTDVLAVAPLGEDAYGVVIDGKASRQGRVGKPRSIGIPWSGTSNGMTLITFSSSLPVSLAES
ncbi:MAG: hypothetical protein H0W06_13330 [Chloroflexia bacterium]|nr:hypothetical protein [Chloroflexia bacterium]